MIGLKTDLIDPNDDRILFHHHELQCPVTFKVRLAPQFGDDLITLRRKFGLRMLVNSCCRSQIHNENIGGHEKSLHVYDIPYHNTKGTCGIDIDCPDNNYAHMLGCTAMGLGWSVGRKGGFMHLDRRDYLGMPTAFFSY